MIIISRVWSIKSWNLKLSVILVCAFLLVFLRLAAASCYLRWLLCMCSSPCERMVPSMVNGSKMHWTCSILSIESLDVCHGLFYEGTVWGWTLFQKLHVWTNCTLTNKSWQRGYLVKAIARCKRRESETQLQDIALIPKIYSSICHMI